MDHDEMARVQQDLVDWGLAEPAEQGIAWTRRFRGAVMREAARLAELEKRGDRPTGHPVENAVGGALTSTDLPEEAALTDAHRRFLVAMELATLPDGLREILS